MNIITKMLARREAAQAQRQREELCDRLASTLKPCPELRERRLRQMSPERAERYRRNMAAIQAEIGGAQ